MKLTLDLHDIYNRGSQIDGALRALMDEAVQKKAKSAEIITGKGSGQLKKRVLRFLEQKEVKALYHRVEKEPAELRTALCPLSVEMMGAGATRLQDQSPICQTFLVASTRSPRSHDRGLLVLASSHHHPRGQRP